MSEGFPSRISSRKAKAEDLFIRADQAEADGDLRSAFRLYLAGAKLGESGCQLNLGNYYDDAKGVRRNRQAALYWYKRAYRRGSASAAYNIGVLWRKEGKYKRALLWFRKAVRMGDDEANLEIAKHFLRVDGNSRRAIPHLQKVCSSDWATEAGREEAAKLLDQFALKRAAKERRWPSS